VLFGFFQQSRTELVDGVGIVHQLSAQLGHRQRGVDVLAAAATSAPPLGCDLTLVASDEADMATDV
jgi:hypothetical protein